MTTSPEQLREEAQLRALKLMESIDLPAGTALVATGSFARGEMTPKSDLDLILLHEEHEEPQNVEGLWYQIWDAKMRLDYSVRTPKQCVEMVSQDVTAALALLDAKHISGNSDLTDQMRVQVLEAWRHEAKRNFNHIVDTAIARWHRSGSVVSMTKPDLKHGRGGLRDIELIQALSLANLANKPQLDEQRQLLLDARTMLHVNAGRLRDVLDPELAVDVSIALGFSDRYELSRAIAKAAKEIDAQVNKSLSTARDLLPRRTVVKKTVRRPVDVDVVDVDGHIELSRHPDLQDTGLPLRVAAASVRTGLIVSEATWHRLKEVPPPHEVFSADMASDFLALLSSSKNSMGVIEKMDEHGLWERYVPEWKYIRGWIPSEPTHIHTVDKHSLEVVSLCARNSVKVARPDLLFLSALFHDIGKGHDRPHEEVGAEMVAKMAERLRLSQPASKIVETVVAQHTLIPRIVYSMDPESDEALDRLLDAVGYDPTVIDILAVLVEADSLATGPGVFNSNLRYGLKTLCSRARTRLQALSPEEPDISVDEDLGISYGEGDDPTVAATISWRGEYQRESVRIFALIVAKGWNIQNARMRVNEQSHAVELELDVYNTLGTGFSIEDIRQTYKSGVFSMLPALSGALTATYWKGDVLEVRTTDRLGALGALIGALPPIKWLKMSNPGATMIVQCQMQPGFERAFVEREVSRVLATG